MTKSRLGAMVLLVGTFVLGGLLGGALTSWGERRSHDFADPSFAHRAGAGSGISSRSDAARRRHTADRTSSRPPGTGASIEAAFASLRRAFRPPGPRAKRSRARALRHRRGRSFTLGGNTGDGTRPHGARARRVGRAGLKTRAGTREDTHPACSRPDRNGEAPDPYDHGSHLS